MVDTAGTARCRFAPVVARLDGFEVREAYGMFYIACPRDIGPDTTALFLEWLRDERPDARLHPTLYDMRNSDLSDITTETVKRWVHQSAKNPDRQEAPRAIVVEGESAYGTMRMLQILADARNITDEGKFLVTYSLVEGIRWLRRMAAARR